MDILYNALVNKLAADVPELRWIDMDTGQYEFFEDNYPVDFPACLIQFPNIDWQDLQRGLQTGDVTVTFRVGFKITEDTHATAPDRAAATDRLKLLNNIHRALHYFNGTAFNALTRRNTNFLLLGDKPLILVYTLTYITNLRDAYGMPQETQQVVDLHSIDASYVKKL